NQIPCEKCHADIVDELSLGVTHIKQKGDPSAADGQDCTFCHRINSSITYARGDGAKSREGKEAHAATLIQCMYCHAPGLYGAPEAGGFGLTGGANDTGIYAAHREFVMEARNGSLMLDENEACISCHTQVNLNFNYTTTRVMGIVIEDSYSPDGSSVSPAWTFYQDQTITYRVNSTDRTVRGTYVVVS
ncbi:MAG: hypothetical protein Q9M13_06900, partial [Mariprofundales bacterium]|nr:hypothetical protein [Mariprofundales bacterium]